MARFPKPDEGSWTEHYPELGTAPVDYTDSVDPEFYEAEQDAVFRKCWLNVGRIEQVPRKGSYFTKEIDAAGTSIIVVRAGEDRINAFHNICRHRGNKLVWNEHPGDETSGMCRQFECKYHAWRFDLEGELTFVQQEGEFFDLDKKEYGLAGVQCEVWEGFIFVNFDPDNTTPLKDYMGKFGQGLEGYPFHELTQVHRFRSEIGANWKLFIDAFAEFYHAPILHGGQYMDEEARKIAAIGFEGLHYELDGPHGMVSSWGTISPPKNLDMVKPLERAVRSGLFGPWDAPDIGMSELPPGCNPAKSPIWGEDTYVFFPNFMLLIWERNWVITYHYWPTSHNTHIFEAACYFAPPQNAKERLAQEYAAVSVKEYALQDGNTLEATQSMIESNTPVKSFPLNDQEILCRHLHNQTRQYVENHRKSK